MSYSEYANQVEERQATTQVDDAFHVAEIEHWELADFEDILG